MATLSLDHVSKVFPNGHAAATDVSFDVPSGGFCVLLGPSGCGKSTTLRMVAGLESVSRGSIRIDGSVVNDVHPKDRDIAMVFQSYALYPHLTVAQNIAFPLSMRGVPRRDIEPKVRSAADMLELGDLLHRRPAQLSGGQRQRVALARAIVRQPKVFLFDEPLSNLDARLRHHTRTELKSLHHRLRITSLYVTHDQEEAMCLADTLVVMSQGRVRQIGSPMDVFDAPADRFVAAFVGSPPMNFIDADVVAGPAGRPALRLPGSTALLPLSPIASSSLPPLTRVTLGIRPGSCRLVDPADPHHLRGSIAAVELLGEVMDATVRVESGLVVARVPAQRSIRHADPVALNLDLSKAHLFAPGPDGERLPLALAPARDVVPAAVR
jgi:ABC-type sugar transport system ATPase subunit